MPLPEPGPEAWLRGPLKDVHPLIAPSLYGFQQAREDLARYTEGLTTKQIWAAPQGFGSLGFHLRHIAGSVDRLSAYLRGQQLSEAQMEFLAREHEPGAAREELLEEMNAAFQWVEAFARSLDVTRLAEPREVGRKRLPTTVIGLLTHIAEHTQRHVGQAISAAKLARAAARDEGKLAGGETAA